MNFDQTWDKYENGFGDFQGETKYSLFSPDSKHHYPSNVEKFILNCQILNYLVFIMIITCNLCKEKHACTSACESVTITSHRVLLNPVSSDLSVMSPSQGSFGWVSGRSILCLLRATLSFTSSWKTGNRTGASSNTDFTLMGQRATTPFTSCTCLEICRTPCANAINLD